MAVANEYAYDVYNCNIDGLYQQALCYADSALYCLNKHYIMYSGSKGPLLELEGEGVAADLDWFNRHFDTDYYALLDVRNEAAVAFLALGNLEAYRYNNNAYTALGNIHFGEKLNEEGAYTDRVLAVKEVFDRCGIMNIIDPDMIKGIWFKFMCNVGENLTCALLGIPFGVFRTSDHANAIRRKAMEEVVLIAQELGVDLGKEDMDRQESTLMALPFQNKPSTLQDLEAGKRTEIDMFAGTVIEYGRKLGIATPVNEMFYHAIHVLEEKCGGSFQAAN